MKTMPGTVLSKWPKWRVFLWTVVIALAFWRPLPSQGQNSNQLVLAITNYASADCAGLGLSVNFFTTVTDLGLVTASNIEVQEVFSSGLTVLATNIPPGTSFDASTLTWFITNLTAGSAV